MAHSGYLDVPSNINYAFVPGRKAAVVYSNEFRDRLLRALSVPELVEQEAFRGPVISYPNGARVKVKEELSDPLLFDPLVHEYRVIKLPRDKTPPQFVQSSAETVQPEIYPFVWVTSKQRNMRPYEMYWKEANKNTVAIAAKAVLIRAGIKREVAIRYARGSDTLLVMPRTSLDTDESMRLVNIRQYSTYLMDRLSQTGERATLPLEPAVLHTHWAAFCMHSNEFAESYLIELPDDLPKQVPVCTFAIRERGPADKQYRKRIRDQSARLRKRVQKVEIPTLEEIKESQEKQVKDAVEVGAFALPKGFVDESAYVPPPKAAERLARMNPEVPKELTEEDLQRIEQQKEIAKKEWERYAALARGSSPPE